MANLVETIRKRFGDIDTKRDEGLTSPRDITRLDDIRYGEDPMQVLDLYLPQNITPPDPVIVHVHGGGWVYGDKDRYQHYCMSLARRGFAVVNFSYRLAPEHTYPASLEDTALVMDYLYKNAAMLHLDLHHVFMAGDSAGAHLLCDYLNARTNPAHNQFAFIHQDIRIKAISLNCGAYMFADDQSKQLITCMLGDHDIQEVEILPYVNSDYPSVHLVTCQDDFLRNDAKALLNVLIDKHIPTTFHYYTSKERDVLHCFFLNIKDPLGWRANEDLCNYFKTFL